MRYKYRNATFPKLKGKVYSRVVIWSERIRSPHRLAYHHPSSLEYPTSINNGNPGSSRGRENDSDYVLQMGATRSWVICNPSNPIWIPESIIDLLPRYLLVLSQQHLLDWDTISVRKIRSLSKTLFWQKTARLCRGRAKAMRPVIYSNTRYVIHWHCLGVAYSNSIIPEATQGTLQSRYVSLDFIDCGLLSNWLI